MEKINDCAQITRHSVNTSYYPVVVLPFKIEEEENDVTNAIVFN